MTSTLPSSSSAVLLNQHNQEGAVHSSSSNSSSVVGDPHNESDDDVQFVGVIPARPMRSSVWTQAPLAIGATNAVSIESEGGNEALPDAIAPSDAANASVNAPAAAVSDVPQSASGEEEAPAGAEDATRADGDVSVTVAAIDRREFDTWDELTTYLDVYSARTHQVYVIKTSTPVANRNARLGRQSHSQSNQYVPDEFRAYAKTYTCTHAGVARHRSTGQRPGTSSRRLGCPARFNACVQRTKTHKWKVRITHHHAIHNHAVGSAMFAQYPMRRRVTDPRVLHTVNILRRVGVEPKKIRAYIHADSSARPTLEDVYNLLAKQRRVEDESSGGTGDVQETTAGDGD